MMTVSQDCGSYSANSKENLTGDMKNYFVILAYGLVLLALAACEPVKLQTSSPAITQPDVIVTPVVTPAENSSEELNIQEESITTAAPQTETETVELLEETVITNQLALKADEAETTIEEVPETPIIEKKQVAVISRLKPVNQLGKKQTQLRALIGLPDIQRAEGNIVTWQYQQADCVVDFFFNRNAQSAENPTVFSWDMRAKEFGRQLDQLKCEAQLADRKSQARG